MKPPGGFPLPVHAEAARGFLASAAPRVPPWIWDLRLKQICGYVNKYEVCSLRSRLMAGEAGLDLSDISN